MRERFDAEIGRAGAGWSAGIDLSGWQDPDATWPELTWAQWAIIKATEGGHFYETLAEGHARHAIARGIPWGLYHFARWNLGEDTWFCQAVDRCSAAVGARPSFVVLDLEAETGHDQTAWAESWCRHVEAHTGIPVVIYTAKWWTDSWLTQRGTGLERRPLWVAHYPGGPVAGPLLPSLWSDWAAWQWTDKPLDYNVAKPEFLELIGGRLAPAGKATPMPTGADIVRAAQQWVGTVEQPPGSNNVPGITDLSGPCAWCALSVTRWFRDAGAALPAVNGGVGFSLCSSGVQYAYENGEAVPIEQARAGDVVIFSWEPWEMRGGVPTCTSSQWDGYTAGDHVGIVRADYDGSGVLYTIEGNTASWNDADGIYVAERERDISLVCCIWRPASIAGGAVYAPAGAPSAPVAADASYSGWPPTPLAPGARGSGVIHLQLFLNHLATAWGNPELHPGATDGDFGPKTMRAVTALQRVIWGEHAHAETDGMWGPMTCKRCEDYMAGIPVEGPPPVRHEPPAPPPPAPPAQPVAPVFPIVQGPDAPDPTDANAVWVIAGSVKVWVPDGATFDKLGGMPALKSLPWVVLSALPAAGDTYPGYSGPVAA